MRTLGYVISATRDDGSVLYMSVDAESGGYGYWSLRVQDAVHFDTEYAAGEHLLKEDARSWDSFLHGAAGTAYATPTRSVTIAVERLQTVAAKGPLYSVSMEALYG